MDDIIQIPPVTTVYMIFRTNKNKGAHSVTTVWSAEDHPFLLTSTCYISTWGRWGPGRGTERLIAAQLVSAARPEERRLQSDAVSASVFTNITLCSPQHFPFPSTRLRKQNNTEKQNQHQQPPSIWKSVVTLFKIHTFVNSCTGRGGL